MAERRSSFSFRFWSQQPARRTPAATTSTRSPPRAEPQTSTPNPPTQRNPTQPAAAASAPSPFQPRAESQTTIQTPANVTDSPSSNTPPITETKAPSDQLTTTLNPPPITEGQTTKETTNSNTSVLRDKPQTLSPPRATPQSPPSPERASTSRKASQSRSPPLPSSPSREGTQARSRPSSPSRSVSGSPRTQRAPQPRSPSRLVSRSPKQTPTPASKAVAPTSPLKESRRSSTGETSNSHEVLPDEYGSNLAPSQQETPEPKAEIEANNDNNEGDGASNKQKEIEPMPTPAEGPVRPPPSKNSDTISKVSGEQKLSNESNEEQEEITEVKEVVQATNAEANEETKEVDDFLKQKSEVQGKEDTPRKPDQMHGENSEGKNVKSINTTTVKPANTNAQPRMRRVISNTRNQNTATNGEDLPLHKDIRDDISTFVNRMGIGDPKDSIQDRPVSMITLAGENRGASMQMGSDFPKREGPVHIHRGYKLNPEESPEVSTDGEGSFKRKNQENAKSTEDQPTEAYVNNNAQGINNSIVFNSSVTEGSPGVHMVINLVAKEMMESTEKARAETRKAEFSATPSEKHTYEPTVRRRCLRGLLLESSDSDPENPEKPRRHGCRVGCKTKGEENNIDVL